MYTKYIQNNNIIYQKWLTKLPYLFFYRKNDFSTITVNYNDGKVFVMFPFLFSLFVYLLGFPPPLIFHYAILTKSYKSDHRHYNLYRSNAASAHSLVQNINSNPLAATVTPHECMSSYRIIHLNEGKWPYSDFRRTLPFEARLLVEGHQEILTHKDGTAHIR